jgi:ABC-type multidrug transport system fused ATPase/permease subunit
VPLNEDEQRILAEIERQFHAEDPESARRIASTTLHRYLVRNSIWSFVGLLVGLAILLVAFASSWILGVFGFLIMVASAVVLVQNLRKMSRLGVEQVTRSMGAHNLNQAFDEYARKLRRRLRGEEE